MLLTDRRIALLHAALAGMEALWLTLFFLLFWPAADHTVLSYALSLTTGALAWVLLVDVVGILAPSATSYRWWIVGIVVAGTVLLIRSVLYPRVPLGDLSWVSTMLDNLVRLDGGLRPEAVLMCTNVFLWLRASWSTNRNLTSLGVESSMRFGLVLLLIAGVWGYFVGQSVPPIYVPLYLGLGLVAVTVARSDERASRASTEGRRLPLGRLAQFLAVVAGFVGIAWWLNRTLPGPVEAVLSWLLVVFELGVVVFQVLFVLAVILGTQIGQWLGRLLGLERGETSAPGMTSLQALADALQRRLEEGATRDIALSPGLLTALRYVPLVVLLLLVGLIFWLMVRRTRRRRRRRETENEDRASFDPGGLLCRAGEQLRDLAGMVQRFGVNRQLLAAISVQNIYANVSQLAARHGHPRPTSMPPDDYLPILFETFEGCDEALARITQAYMRVHYGDHPVTVGELGRLRTDYQAIRRSRPEHISTG